ncbi:LysM peptidoglycan-binding domain-containing protein [Limosilactobacillus reuteri]|uniref:LysM peptidoglycan-binding domain-containing protein n=1 Tax=Limosilactobacillus reuteri TaxID=1598 RepID=UPI001E4E839B|nr:LysM peptidoglycan-binding domain-containing protein [Limosilactobacillus reuteri]MCC4501822.1 LysM peptidoglycan-binding domain-containing protein [Limosilactobacillus reuteri]
MEERRNKSAIVANIIAIIAMIFLLALSARSVSANTERSYGGDYSRYQPNLYNNTGRDQFAISQIGGSENGYIYNQSTYSSHAQQARQRGWRFHTYIWDETGSNTAQTDAMLNYFIPRLEQPKGAIVALDYESGATYNVEANTDNILYGMRKIRDAGYTPVLYSYKPYLMAHVDVNRVIAEFPNSLWVAGYQPGLSTMPNYNYFPSMSGVAMWQYSDYGGQQDMNVDLTGITFNGYTQNKQQQQPTKPATTPVQQPSQNSNTGYYTVQSGDSFWSIAQKYNMNMYTLAASNGLNINAFIYPGQRLKVNTGNGSQAQRRYTVRAGDSFWAIGQRFGESMCAIAAKNNMSINSVIYPGQVLNV